MEPVREKDLTQVLARYAYAVVPSDTFDGGSSPSVRAIAELSLPSRIPTLMCASHLPILVLGHAQTSAARFVRRFELGEVTPYETAAVQGALARLGRSETQERIRRRAAELSPSFSSRGATEWIWRSLAEGRACDEKYEHLMPADA